MRISLLVLGMLLLSGCNPETGLPSGGMATGKPAMPKFGPGQTKVFFVVMAKTKAARILPVSVRYSLDGHFREGAVNDAQAKTVHVSKTVSVDKFAIVEAYSYDGGSIECRGYIGTRAASPVQVAATSDPKATIMVRCVVEIGKVQA